MVARINTVAFHGVEVEPVDVQILIFLQRLSFLLR